MILNVLMVLGATWGLAELKSAMAQGSAQEVLERCGDVLPAERSAEWKTVVADAASQAVAATPPGPKTPWAPLERAMTLQKRHPFLSDHKRFGAARDAAATASLKACLATDANDCLEVLRPHIESLSHEAALELAKTMRAITVPYAPMPLLRRAVAAEARCADPLVAEVTLAALGTAEDSDVAKDARAVAFETCFKALQPALKKAMVGASSYLLRNACGPMRARRALTELQDDLCKDEGR